MLAEVCMYVTFTYPAVSAWTLTTQGLPGNSLDNHHKASDVSVVTGILMTRSSLTP
jgi:hypothetical protein